MVLRFGHTFQTSHNNHTVGAEFAKLVKEKTNGQCQIKIFPNAVLGSEVEMDEMVMAGTLDITPSGGILSNFWPKLGVIDLPYMIRDFDHADKVLYGPAGEELSRGIFKTTGMKVLVWWPSGFRITLCRKRPIKRLEDFKGIKIRTHQNPVVVRTFNLLGASPVPMSFTEVYTGLQTGVIDAMESPASTIAAMKFVEVAKNLSHTDHFFSMNALLINNKKFESLPPNVQKAITEAAKDTIPLMKKILAKNIDDGLKQILAGGATDSYPDLKPFRKAVEPIYDEFGKKLDAKALIAKIRE
jgi:tripartite ATP-independent transporter DctP family solute receptor